MPQISLASNDLVFLGEKKKNLFIKCLNKINNKNVKHVILGHNRVIYMSG